MLPFFVQFMHQQQKSDSFFLILSRRPSEFITIFSFSIFIFLRLSVGLWTPVFILYNCLNDFDLFSKSLMIFLFSFLFFTPLFCYVNEIARKTRQGKKTFLRISFITTALMVRTICFYSMGNIFYSPFSWRFEMRIHKSW